MEAAPDIKYACLASKGVKLSSTHHFMSLYFDYYKSHSVLTPSNLFLL